MCVVVAVVCCGSWAAADEAVPSEIESTLQVAGNNREQLELAWKQVPEDQRTGMKFLLQHMPERDSQSLSAEFLLTHTQLAYESWRNAPWADQIPEDVFLNDLLPYASINERRDDWRADFQKRFLPLVKDAQTASQAAAILNQKIFPLLSVKYSTQRNRADQGPYESISTGLASCTGLSILLIDACRSVGIPARFVGTPLWSDNSGNHSWVEVWDNGWHFTGAAEPTGEELDKAWFTARASKAIADDPRHAIYAVSFRRTPLSFPLVWDRSIDYVSAVNVTSRYTSQAETLPAGTIRAMFVLRHPDTKQRVAADFTITDAHGTTIASGKTNDERFDRNDHVSVVVRQGQQLDVSATSEDIGRFSRQFTATEDGQLVELTASRTISALKHLLGDKDADFARIIDEPFARVPLSADEASRAAKLLADHSLQRWRMDHREEFEAKVITIGELKMPFDYRIFGEKPEGGRSLFISLHGGGGAPKEVNDGQWENQKQLYEPHEGVYVAPRAPTNTWDLWHQAHMDAFFDRLIRHMVAFEEVNPDRVYLMGYSAGGDGVYQVAPRMADRWAAAAMMAGHPNETSPLGLRNVPFTLHMGGNDGAYDRNAVAAEWKQKLADLHDADPDGYVHWVEIHEGKGHWMDREDAAAVPWMAQFSRRRFPTRVVWKQDDVASDRYYWLAMDDDYQSGRPLVTASISEQTITIEHSDVPTFRIRLNDEMLDLDQPVTVRTAGGEILFEGTVDRTISTIAHTLAERGDPGLVFSSEITVTLPDAK